MPTLVAQRSMHSKGSVKKRFIALGNGGWRGDKVTGHVRIRRGVGGHRHMMQFKDHTRLRRQTTRFMVPGAVADKLRKFGIGHK